MKKIILLFLLTIWMPTLAWAQPAVLPGGQGPVVVVSGGGSGGTPDAHAASHKNGGSDEVATATPAANAIPKAGAGGTLGVGWLPSTVTLDAELDTFGEWKTFTAIGGTCDNTSFVRGDGVCSIPSGSGDVSSNTASSVDSEVALFSSTGGKTIKRATGTGIARLAAGVLSAAEPSGDILFNGSNVGTIQANSVALGTDTTGNYVAGVTGTANEITVSHTPSEGSTATLSLPTGIDAAKIGGGVVSSTEFDTLDNIAGNIQGLLNTKQATITADSLGPTQIDETAQYNWTGAQTIDTWPLRGMMSSAACDSEDIPAGGFCMNTGTPWTVYRCPLTTGLCDDPGESKAGLTAADIPAPLSLNGAAANGRFILGANSEANATIPACIDNNTDGDCTDGGDSGFKMFVDPVDGPTFLAYPPGHLTDNIPTGFAKITKGSAGELERLTSAGVHTYSSVKPLKSVEPAGHVFGAGTYTEGVLAASKPVTGYFTLTDIDTDGFDFDFISPDSWDAGTVTVEIAALSTAASPSGNLVMSCSGQSVRSADVIANRATTGEQNATITFATQYKEQHATTAAITLQGTVAAGAHLYMHCDVDATLTTTTMATVAIITTPKIEYAIGSRSDG